MLERRAFTMLELLIVVTIIAVMAGGTLAILGVIKVKTKRLQTSKMIQEEVVTAINAYLGQWPSLGDRTGQDFRAAPWQYLYTRPKRTALGPLTELPVNRLVTASAGGTSCSAVQRAEAGTHIIDYFGTAVDNLLNFIVIESGSGRARYTKIIEIRSSAGTPSVARDDILYRYVASGACDTATKSYAPGDAGHFVLVTTILSAWIDPLDGSSASKMSDDQVLQQQATQSK